MKKTTLSIVCLKKEAGFEAHLALTENTGFGLIRINHTTPDNIEAELLTGKGETPFKAARSLLLSALSEKREQAFFHLYHPSEIPNQKGARIDLDDIAPWGDAWKGSEKRKCERLPFKMTPQLSRIALETLAELNRHGAITKQTELPRPLLTTETHSNLRNLPYPSLDIESI
jgi:hypothetical protein